MWACGGGYIPTLNPKPKDGNYNKLAPGISIIPRTLNHVGYSLNSLKGVMQGII